MVGTLKLALAQLNPTVGAIDVNADLVRKARAEAAAAGADLVVCAELVISGYPPEDLVLRDSFMEHVEEAVLTLAEETADGGPGLLIGTPWSMDGHAFNAAILLDAGEVAAIRFKHRLPNYGVFDEARFFVPGPPPTPMNFRGVSLGVMICEDMWYPGVANDLAADGAELMVVINGSPFEMDKRDQRLEHAMARISETKLPMVYVNQVGGQDELAFDGGSFTVGARGTLRCQLPSWQEAMVVTEWTKTDIGWACATNDVAPIPERWEGVYQAMMLGLRDYVNKNGFPGVVLGLSGGIDSALSAAVAVDALGADRVRCVMMPSPYTSIESLQDAGAIGELLGTGVTSLSIEPAMDAFDLILEDSFGDLEKDTTEENIQARSRGLTLMALSNKFGHMVLSTGNKSEMSVGYATLYGDMCGGYSVLKDIYKISVFQICKWRNSFKPVGALGPDGEVMPERVITKPPSAELKFNQTDQDSLPPYDELDDILKCLIEAEMGLSELVARGHDEALVQRVWRMINRAEYKRRQAPPGVKITSRAFGRDRRYPITDAFEELA